MTRDNTLKLLATGLCLFILGVVVGLAVAAHTRGQREIKLYEIDEEMKRLIADPMYELFCAGKVSYRRRVPILGFERWVDIVDMVRGGECGFLPSDARHLYINRPHEYIIFQFNGTHAFILLEARYAMALEKSEAAEAADDEAEDSTP